MFGPSGIQMRRIHIGVRRRKSVAMLSVRIPHVRMDRGDILVNRVNVGMGNGNIGMWTSYEDVSMRDAWKGSLHRRCYQVDGKAAGLKSRANRIRHLTSLGKHLRNLIHSRPPPFEFFSLIEA
ncbi:hypothetical protein [Bradyrhizobium quebecense]|uniref:Uncharacterized protein n=2 Tax=Bradyrhizobium quebecense TaxID=2748629 RepID=A0ABS3MTE1_9BRAD|nr:hypothetical protein [Bradyrhizobium quebecense]UGY02535.1 hypothetical protein J4P68_0036555 [Bradyrhizobium quebecense]